MFKLSVCSMGAAFFLGLSLAQGASLGLGSDPKTIKAKSSSIESEYSRNMRAEKQGEEVKSAAPKVTVPAVRPGSVAAEIRSIPGATNTYYSQNSFSYSSTLKMREDRKVGAGLSVGGTLGLAGFNMELNFEDADGVIAGFGTGPGYNSVQLAWKHAFEGDYLAPYASVGYSRWYNSRGSSNNYGSSDILDRVLTSNEKKTGQFGTDFVNTSLGLQYNQLTGDLAGLSFFGELTAMWEVKRSMLLPNGSIGAIYYF
ncbi:MAG: hypothetical protein KUL82_00750 [Bdellovibrio sp.]|nr:hypothetical protein [Bdellovibrio sp.]